MPKRSLPHHRYRHLRHLIAPLWIADLLDIFEIETPTELEHFLEGIRYKKTYYGDELIGASGAYWRYWKGYILPDDPRVLRLCEERGQSVARVLELPLCQVLDIVGYVSQDELNSILYQLSEEVRDVMFRLISGARTSIERNPANNEISARLEEIGDVDALTALLVILKELNLRVEPEEYHNVTEVVQYHAWRTFFFLMVFPPFYDIIRPIVNHFQKRVFVRVNEFGNEQYQEPDGGACVHAIERFHVTLEYMIGLGLVGATFREQLAFLKSLTLLHVGALSAIEAAYQADKPYRLSPSNPLWELLKDMKHPSVESAESILLPLGGSLNSQIRVANALGEAKIKSYSPSPKSYSTSSKNGTGPSPASRSSSAA